jgi:hypothetical protein
MADMEQILDDYLNHLFSEYEQSTFIDPWDQPNDQLKNNDSTFYNLLNKQD